MKEDSTKDVREESNLDQESMKTFQLLSLYQANCLIQAKGIIGMQGCVA